MFSSEIGKIFKNSFFTEHLRVTASIFVNFELLVIVCSGVSNATLNKKMSAVYKLLLLQKIEENACSSSRLETLEIDIKYVPSDRKDTN